MTAAVDAAREALIEMVAEADEAADGEVLRGRHADRRGAGRAACAAATGAGKLFPLVCTSALAEHRRAAAARRRSSPTCRRPPSGRSRASTRPAPRSARPADEKAPAAAFVWKTIADPFAGRITMFRVVSGTLKSDSTVHNKTQGRAGAARAPRAAAGQDADAGAGDQGRRSRRGRQAEGHADQRHARRQGGSDRRSRRSSSRSRCCRTRSSRRPAATRTRSAPRCTASRRRTRRFTTAAIRRPRSCCSRDRASCTSR